VSATESQRKGVLALRERIRAFARHYLRDMVYAAHDGVVTTFAVVAGVRGAHLGYRAVLALGLANLAADGLSMAIGNYLGIKSERAADLQENFHEWDETTHALRHAAVTWFAFGIAGAMPLLPYLAGSAAPTALCLSMGLSAVTLFSVGVLRTQVTAQPAWRSGLEMLVVGALAGGAAFLVGEIVGRVIPGGRAAG
jgi:vacuolar iron transporter family protein